MILKTKLNYKIIAVNSDPLCTLAQIKKANSIVRRSINDLTKQLPKDHFWKRRKLIHQENVARKARLMLAKHFGRRWPKENYALVEFIGQTHDLGRFAEAIIWLKQKKKTDHAIESVKLLRELGIPKIFSQTAWAIIRYSILHHAKRFTPALPTRPTELAKLKFIYACLIRDCDKLDNLERKTDRYLNIPEEKANHIKYYPFFKGEQKKIKPESLINQFDKQKSLPLFRCRSYEAYMLFALAWIFDLNSSFVLQRIVKRGIIQKYLRYFKKQLPQKQYLRIEQTVKDFLKKSL
jgi:hypothetical protein